ncbi:uncharacterized protein F4812DRAFT_432895 [Daldinia caldariorum]|uniref:uncharacterized protein n=1 Tax=Daldinia caldariorum TaxID=326644 RepID=UPI002007DC0B|nr:uncharacterized protein F4812DRAFT_432895 [Daldinia caldariorum]KAI1466816.1 hypothetical protein F4812DRAFT_432895 [Daldinia caldariorum]
MGVPYRRVSQQRQETHGNGLAGSSFFLISFSIYFTTSRGRQFNFLFFSFNLSVVLIQPFLGLRNS